MDKDGRSLNRFCEIQLDPMKIDGRFYQHVIGDILLKYKMINTFNRFSNRKIRRILKRFEESLNCALTGGEEGVCGGGIPDPPNL